MRQLLLFVVLGTLIVGIRSANAGFVTNGGFETGDFSGWQHFFDASSSDDGVSGGGLFPPASGNFAAHFSAFNTTTSGISQLLSTVPGQVYTLSFQLRNLDDPLPDFDLGNSCLVQVGATTLLSGKDVPASPYQLFSAKFTASAFETPLAFTFNNELSWFLLDDVTVEAVTSTPEPSSLALCSLAILGLVASRVWRALYKGRVSPADH